MNITRPFFSIIVPCYNSGPYIYELLESIHKQYMKNDIEVILVDDNSDISYESIIDKYRNKLNIKYVESTYDHGYPGNTRQYGILYATGEWITFLDHDDTLIPNTFKKIKKEIIKKKEKYYCIAGFYEVNYETKEIEAQYSRVLGWIHGKFYNKDNFWKYLSFPKNQKSQEDVSICTQANCYMEYLNRKPLYLDIYCYNWYMRKESFSRTSYIKNGNMYGYMEYYFNDYIKSTGNIYLQKKVDNIISDETSILGILEVLVLCYWYLMKFIFDKPDNYLKENIEYIKKLYRNGNKLFPNYCNPDYIYKWLSDDRCIMYKTIMKEANIIAEDCIPCMTIKEYLNLINQV